MYIHEECYQMDKLDKYGQEIRGGKNVSERQSVKVYSVFLT